MKCKVIVTAIIEREGKILLGKKAANIGPYPNTWHFPGGSVNLGEESTVDAIKREIREETGIEVKGLERVNFDEDYENDKYGQLTHYIILIFIAKYKSGSAKAGDDLKTLEWIDKNKLGTLKLTRPSDKFLREIKWIY